ncbi:hypothetical protein ACTNLV_004697, partial [Vibrio alginolyticus]
RLKSPEGLKSAFTLILPPGVSCLPGMRTSPERLDWVMMVMNVHYKITHTYFKALLICFVTNHTNQADYFFQPLILKKFELYNTNKKGGRSLL